VGRSPTLAARARRRALADYGANSASARDRAPAATSLDLQFEVISVRLARPFVPARGGRKPPSTTRAPESALLARLGIDPHHRRHTARAGF
jgi:hypothetical protein